jgi:hypothetical protein
MQKEVGNKGGEIKRQEKEAMTTQRIATTTNANIMRIQRQVKRQERIIFNNV